MIGIVTWPRGKANHSCEICYKLLYVIQVWYSSKVTLHSLTTYVHIRHSNARYAKLDHSRETVKG